VAVEAAGAAEAGGTVGVVGLAVTVGDVVPGFSTFFVGTAALSAEDLDLKSPFIFNLKFDSAPIESA